MQHLDEGTVHAWLDGELSADEAERMAAHASECSECGALVAEARGLIAASTRILTALDDVPAGVVPSGSTVSEKPTAVGGPVFRRHWYDRTDLRAAAALLFVAGASLVVVKAGRNPTPSMQVATRAARPATVAPLLQDAGQATAAAVEAPQTPRAFSGKASEENASGGGTTNSLERRRSENAVAAAPPVVSSRVAEKPSARAFGMLRGMDEASRSKTMDIIQSVAPAPGRVQGQVVDKEGKALPSVNVLVEGTNLGATTDQQGHFVIDNVPFGDRRIVVRRIGYAAQTVPVAVTERSDANATVALTPMTTQLSEVMVTGVAAATSASATTLRVVKADTTGTTRRVVYQVSPGVEVTLVEAPVNAAAARELAANKQEKDAKVDSVALQGRVAGATVRSMAKTDRAAAQAQAPAPMVMSTRVSPPINTISWSDQNRQYTLSGPLKPTELEAIKARLMKMRR